MTKLRQFLGLVVSVVVLGPSCLAAPLPRDEVDRFVRPLVDGEYCQAVVVGVVDEGGPRVFGYGTVGKGTDAPTGQTVFEIGSTTKVFTSLLLAEMARKGDVALDDPVQKYLPDSVKLPQRGERPITLADLASHTSGLPRMPDNFAPRDPANPYADYTPARLYQFLAKWEPARAPGESFDYSNLGAGLLGHALSRAGKKSYERLMVERVCKPLGMNDTAIALSPAMKRRLAPGHGPDGEPAKNWDLATLEGAGGLRSTVDDMVKFLAASLRPEGAGDLAGPLREIQKTRARADAANDVGLGWHVQAKDRLVWHNGQTGGYHSFASVLPERGVGVVVLADTATMQPDATAMALLRRMAGQKSEPPKLAVPVKVDEKVLDEYVGEYPLSPAFKLTMTRQGRKLMAQATGQQKFRVYAVSDHEFVYRVVDARITFERDGGGKVKGLVLHQNGADLPGRKAR